MEKDCIKNPIWPILLPASNLNTRNLTTLNFIQKIVLACKRKTKRNFNCFWHCAGGNPKQFLQRMCNSAGHFAFCYIRAASDSKQTEEAKNGSARCHFGTGGIEEQNTREPQRFYSKRVWIRFNKLTE